jgi:pterin-4a-carbinolamine dehydratase
MTDTQGWHEKASPRRLERRFEFDTYTSTRGFLDGAAQLSKAANIYPDISFGRTYVNMTIYVQDDARGSSHGAKEYAQQLDRLCACSPAS